MNSTYYILRIDTIKHVLDSIVVSIPACQIQQSAGDRGSIPRRGGKFFFLFQNFLCVLPYDLRPNLQLICQVTFLRGI